MGNNKRLLGVYGFIGPLGEKKAEELHEKGAGKRIARGGVFEQKRATSVAGSVRGLGGP